ncbi:hypothetical protein [Paenibacillus harenae]|uniref:hypothetical protein n=1 Tax=Paenibacillus harenae TaxID=306543 RepID=UPI00048CCA2D|nr:hypothetical protein [Paenibacillus harenae]
MQKLNLIGLILITAAMLCACSKDVSNQPETAITKQVEGTALHVEPIDLFAGEARKFQPFLGTMSGAVKLKYGGNKNDISAKIELWEKGTKTKTYSSIGISMQDSQDKTKDYEGEFIASIKTVSIEGSKPLYEITTAFANKNGTASSITYIDRDIRNTGSNTIQLNKSLDVSENDEVAVWGMQATDKNEWETIDLTPEGLKNAKWALIFKLSVN